jgi:hypothetical protein
MVNKFTRYFNKYTRQSLIMNKQQTSIAERNQIGKHYEDFGHRVRSLLNVDGIFVVGICARKSTKSNLHSVLLNKMSTILIFIHIPDILASP